jgi:hypothetical protein
MDGFVEMFSSVIAVAGLKFFAGVTEQAARFFHLFVGFPLALAVNKVAAEFQADVFTRGLDLMHGGLAMAVIIVIGLFEKMISMGEFLPRRLSVGAQAKSQGNQNCRDAKTKHPSCIIHNVVIFCQLR